MSHYTELQTEMASAKHIAAALRDLGIANVEVHAEPQQLEGFMGQTRTANVIVRRSDFPGSAADIGFARNARGTFDLVFDDMNSGLFPKEWRDELTQRYAYHVTRDTLAQQDFSMVEETRDRDGTIRLTLRRMG